MKVYIFEKYSFRASEWYLAWFQEWPVPTRYDFPGTPLIGNISESINARRRGENFFGVTFKGQSIDISFQCYFLLLIFGIFNTKVSSNTFHSILVVWKDSLAARSTTFTEWN